MWQAKTETAGDFHVVLSQRDDCPRSLSQDGGASRQTVPLRHLCLHNWPYPGVATPDELAGKRTGERIQILRERKGLTRPVLAGLVGMSPGLVEGDRAW